LIRVNLQFLILGNRSLNPMFVPSEVIECECRCAYGLILADIPMSDAFLS